MVQPSKKYVSKMIYSDVNKEGNNISLLIFALQNNVNDCFVKLLVSGATTQDILDLVIYSSHQKAVVDEEVEAIMTVEGDHKDEKKRGKKFESFKKFVSRKFQFFFGKTYPEIDCEKAKKKAEKSSKENSMKFRKSSKIQRSFENLGGEIIGFAL